MYLGEIFSREMKIKSRIIFVSQITSQNDSRTFWDEIYKIILFRITYIRLQ